MSGFRQELRMEQSFKLTQQQRLVLQQFSFSLRIQLIQELRDERYDPQGNCPKCSRELTPMEIISGFSRDVDDFTTRCTRCGCRFEPTLICFSGGAGQVEIPFLCDEQALAQLKGKENLPPQELAREHPGAYRSAIVHHGSIGGAFAKIGSKYEFKEISDWRAKVVPFLGRMRDTLIADCVNAPVSVIRSIRRKLGISRFTAEKALEEGLA